MGLNCSIYTPSRFIEDVKLVLDYHGREVINKSPTTLDEINHAAINLDMSVKCLWQSLWENELNLFLEEKELEKIGFLLKEIELCGQVRSVDNFLVVQEKLLQLLKQLKPCCYLSFSLYPFLDSTLSN